MTSQQVKKELLAQIALYLDGRISREKFYEIAEDNYTRNAHIIENSTFNRIYLQYIPDACLHFIDEPGLAEEEKEVGFRQYLDEAYRALQKEL